MEYTIISCIKDLTLATAAIITSSVAIYGLNTWRRQHVGQVEYDLARRLLKTSYEIRNAINQVRHPMMWSYEMIEPSEDEKKYSREEKRHYGTANAYQKRWEKVQNSTNDLNTDLLEAEAIWGKEIYDIFKPCKDLENELFRNIQDYLQLINPNESDEMKEVIRKSRKKQREIMYDDLTDDNEYKRQYAEALTKIEKYLRPKLSK